MTKPRQPPVFKSVIDEDPEGYYRWYLEQVRKSKPSAARVTAARELLDGFVCAVNAGKSIPHAVIEYLNLGLMKYLDEGVELDEALHLNQPTNRPLGGYTVDPSRAVATMYLFMKRDGYGKEEAKAATCKRLGLSKRNLERYDEKLDALRDFDQAELEHFAQPVAKVNRPAKKSPAKKSR
jgi:hypothetical protein